MGSDNTLISTSNWRAELPVHAGRSVVLREPTTHDLGPLVDLLSMADATRFGLDEPPTDLTIQQLIERAVRDRANGTAFTYVIALATTRAVVGLVQMRQLDPAFEAAEWECTVAPSSRGSGVFLDAVPFPSQANNAFTPFTTPSSRSELGGGLPVSITNIRRLPDGRITFYVGYEYE